MQWWKWLRKWANETWAQYPNIPRHPMKTHSWKKPISLALFPNLYLIILLSFVFILFDFLETYHISFTFHISGIDDLNMNKLEMIVSSPGIQASATLPWLASDSVTHRWTSVCSPLLLPHICRMCNLCAFDCHRGGYNVCADWIWYKLADLVSSKGFDAVLFPEFYSFWYHAEVVSVFVWGIFFYHPP